MSRALESQPTDVWHGTSYGYHSCGSTGHEEGASQAFGIDEVSCAMDRSRQYLLDLQCPDGGYWVGELESNATLTAEYIFFSRFMGTVDELRQRKMVHYLKETQLPDGSWNLYYGGPGDLSTTIEAYTAMRIAGEHPGARATARARDFLLAHGGLEKSRVFTKIFLALLGIHPWEGCPALPPEIMFLPLGFPLNIYEMSSWARATVVPLLVLWHYRPVVPAPESFRIEELIPSGHSDTGLHTNRTGHGWERFFFHADTALKRYEKRHVKWTRERALQKAEKWILDRQDSTGDWAGIMPAMMNSVMALKCRGYDLSHPVIQKGLRAIHRFAIEDGKTLRLQSCVSPVWDTANTCLALLDSGVVPHHPAIREATDWLWSKQISEKGDWAKKNPDALPGGWAFEFENQTYPDNDDTLAVLTALRRSGADGGKPEAWCRGLQWLLSMQCRNGGWAAFDIDNDRQIWNRIPFADHKSMLDPPTSDLTGRVLEFLGGMDYRTDFEPARRAVAFLEAQQESDGSWFGRWGVNYLYGTWCSLCGLHAIGYDMASPRIRRAVHWLVSCQNEDGGWGEDCASYDDPQNKGRGKSTASQTSWALMGLMTAGDAAGEPVMNGIAYLLNTQNDKGSWDEEAFTGTGFPSFFYLRYHMYRDYFPLMALSRYARIGAR